MRWGCFFLVLALCGCSASKHVVNEQRRDIARTDTFAVHLSDDLSVNLRDVIIMPVDTTRARVYIKEVQLRCEQDVEVVKKSTAEEQFTQNETEQPVASRKRHWWLYLILAVVIYAIYRRPKR